MDKDDVLVVVDKVHDRLGGVAVRKNVTTYLCICYIET